MQGSNRALEASEAFEDQQREMRIAATRRTLMDHGAEDCIACGDPIDVARRMALPSARRCIECQEEYELR